MTEYMILVRGVIIALFLITIKVPSDSPRWIIAAILLNLLFMLGG